jgi:hypothetical protein
MEDLRSVLTQAIREKSLDEHKELTDRLVERVCTSLEAGGGSEEVKEAVAAEIDSILESAETTLANAENTIGRHR